MLKVSPMMLFASIFSHASEPAFWDECERASLLLSRATDAAGGNPISRTMLRKTGALASFRKKIYAPAICCYLYASWSALTESVKNRTENGVEPDENHIRTLESANDHIFKRVLPFLSKTEHYTVCELFVAIYNQVSRSMRSREANTIDVEELIAASFSSFTDD